MMGMAATLLSSAKTQHNALCNLEVNKKKEAEAAENATAESITEAMANVSLTADYSNAGLVKPVSDRLQEYISNLWEFFNSHSESASIRQENKNSDAVYVFSCILNMSDPNIALDLEPGIISRKIINARPAYVRTPSSRSLSSRPSSPIPGSGGMAPSISISGPLLGYCNNADGKIAPFQTFRFFCSFLVRKGVLFFPVHIFAHPNAPSSSPNMSSSQNLDGPDEGPELCFHGTVIDKLLLGLRRTGQNTLERKAKADLVVIPHAYGFYPIEDASSKEYEGLPEQNTSLLRVWPDYPQTWKANTFLVIKGNDEESNSHGLEDGDRASGVLPRLNIDFGYDDNINLKTPKRHSRICSIRSSFGKRRSSRASTLSVTSNVSDPDQ